MLLFFKMHETKQSRCFLMQGHCSFDSSLIFLDSSNDVEEKRTGDSLLSSTQSLMCSKMVALRTPMLGMPLPNI